MGVRWLVRRDAPVRATLTEAVREWALTRTGSATRHGAVGQPDDGLLWEEDPDGLYVWLAGECGAITRLRRNG